MMIRPIIVRHGLIAGVLLVCAACGGQQAQPDERAAVPVPSGDRFIGMHPIHAHLSQSRDGSWMFTEITKSDQPSDSTYLVRLNDLAPAFDTRVAACTPQVYPEAHRCNPANPFRDEDSGVLDKIINGGIAVGTAGKVTDISYSYETSFDEARFNQAVDEALLNTNLDRRRLISRITTYDNELADARAELDAAAERLQASRANAARPELDVQPTISGLVEYYQGDIDITELLDFEAVRDDDSPIPKLAPTAILPCEARQCIAAADNALAALRRDVQTNTEKVAAAMRPQATVYDVRCRTAEYGDFLLKTECPAQVNATGERPVILPVQITILSRDFDKLYPRFDLAGPHLRVDIDGRTVRFGNTAGEYLTVSAQTVYYNSSVHTSTLAIDIPPGITITRDLEDFVSQAIDIESSYRQMTPDKAERASFQFGFAVRYQLASQSEAQTLHDSRTFNVGCVIKNRIRPGSCRPGPAAGLDPAQDTLVSDQQKPALEE